MLDGLLVAILLVMGMGTAAALWGAAIALKFKTQSAAPLMQAGMFTLILTARPPTRRSSCSPAGFRPSPSTTR